MRSLVIALFALSGMLALASEAAVSPPSERRIASAGEAGEPFRLDVRLLDGQGRPMRGALVRVYHADASGRYVQDASTSSRLDGVLRTSALGRIRVHTILPGHVEDGPHVHLEVEGADRSSRALSVHLARLEGAGADAAIETLPRLLNLPNEWGWTYVRRDTGNVLSARWDARFERGGRLSVRPPAFRRAGF